MFLNTNLINQLYNKLCQIVSINDHELKFNNVFGYISSMDLDLDKPWEDTIEIKNYTNKFEDLFSSITAQTEAMKKNSGILASFGAGNLPVTIVQSVEDTMTDALQNSPTINNYLMEEFDSAQVVKDTLYDIVDQTNVILGSSTAAIDELTTLNNLNATIFCLFFPCKKGLQQSQYK